MRKKRVIARIDVKNEYAIKGIHLEGLRKVGDPNTLALKYYNSGIDEILFMDAVASYYDRNSLSNVISKASDDIFVPITVGGGIRKIEDIQNALNSGADKVSINTQSIKTPEFIDEASKVFGSQCIVASIEAKHDYDGNWYVYFDNGREPTSKKVTDWIIEVQQRGAGEILLTSVDKEGTKKGMDLELANAVGELCDVPLIICGGVGQINHINEIKDYRIDALSIASVLHYDLLQVEDIKKTLNE